MNSAPTSQPKEYCVGSDFAEQLQNMAAFTSELADRAENLASGLSGVYQKLEVTDKVSPTPDGWFPQQMRTLQHLRMSLERISGSLTEVQRSF